MYSRLDWEQIARVTNFKLGKQLLPWKFAIANLLSKKHSDLGSLTKQPIWKNS